MIHRHGSKEIIDDLNCWYSVTYNGVRRFPISVAENQSDCHDAQLIPKDLTPFEEGNVNTTIDGAMYNFNKMEGTVDEANKTHSMAIIVYQESPAMRKSITVSASVED